MRDEHDSLERLAHLVEGGLGERLSRRELVRRGMALGLSLPAITAALAACGIEPPLEATPISRWRPPEPTAAPLVGRADAQGAGASQTARPAPPTTPPATATPAATATPTPIPATRFAVIGDFGLEGEPEAAVAGLVASWNPEFVVTVGDNNYPSGAQATIDRNIGQFYSQFIAPYRGTFGPGGTENRFWPVLGNHDWSSGYPEPYLSYFTLPGNGRYYSIERGFIRFFGLDSMPGEPDGWTVDSIQATWLQAELAASTARWNAVVLHHSPYSSGHHGSSEWMRWPYAAWGAHLVLGGHDHTYERVQRDGITYVVNGLGGGARYARGFTGLEGSQIFFNADHGAMLIEAGADALHARFITRAEQLIDEFTL